MKTPTAPKQQAVAKDSKGQVYLVTPLSKEILKALSNGKEWTYVELAKHLNAGYPTIAVYAGRLEACGLLKKREEDNRVYLKSGTKVVFNDNMIKV